MEAGAAKAKTEMYVMSLEGKAEGAAKVVSVQHEHTVAQERGVRRVRADRVRRDMSVNNSERQRTYLAKLPQSGTHPFSAAVAATAGPVWCKLGWCQSRRRARRSPPMSHSPSRRQR